MPDQAEVDFSPVRAWSVVGVLMLVYVFSFLDRQILSLMVSDLKSGLGLEHDWQVSILMGPAFAVFYTIFGIPFGRLADSANRTRIVAVGLAFWSLMTVGCGAVRHYWQMLLCRVGVGVGEASLSPSAYSILADTFPPAQLARAIAIYSSGIYFGSGLAYMIGGRAVSALRGTEPWIWPIVGEIAGWQKVFWIVGLPGFLVVPIVLFGIREPKRRGVLRAGASTGAEDASVALPLAEVFAVARQNWRALATHNLGFALLSFSSYGSSAWLPAMFKRVHGWDEATFGLVYGLVVFVGSAGGAICGGILADRLRARGVVDAKIRVGFHAAWLWFPFGIAFPLMGDGAIAMALVVPAAFLASMPFGVAPAALQEMMPNNLRGQASALYLFVINLIGLAIGPLVLALMTDYVFHAEAFGVGGIRWSLLTTTVFAHLGATAILFFGMAEYRKSLFRLGVTPEADGDD